MSATIFSFFLFSFNRLDDSEYSRHGVSYHYFFFIFNVLELRSLPDDTRTYCGVKSKTSRERGRDEKGRDASALGRVTARVRGLYIVFSAVVVVTI